VADLLDKAKAIASRIVASTVTPYDGATAMCELFYECEPGDHSLDDFVFWESEHADAIDDDRRQYCDEAIRAVARLFLRDEYPGGPNWNPNAPRRLPHDIE
jgi:hypothetical protein